jgi:hypothetical protein
VIDVANRQLHLCGPGDIKIQLPPGSTTYDLEKSQSGHLLLPVTEFGRAHSGGASAADDSRLMFQYGSS